VPGWRCISAPTACRWISIRELRMRDGGIVSIRSDITAQKLAEEALRRSRDLLESTGEIAKVGGWELDLVSGRLGWSAEVYRIHELPLDDRISRDVAIAFYPPEVRPTVEKALAACGFDGTPFDLSLPLVAATGRRLQVRIQGKPEWRDGRIVRVFGAIQDITERWQSGQSTRRLAIAAERTSNLVLLLDGERRIEWFNEAFERVSGFTLDDLRGKPVVGIFRGPRTDAARLDALYQSMDPKVGLSDVDIVLYDRNGQELFVRLELKPVIEVDGEVVGYVSIIADLTALKQAQEKLEQGNARLEAIMDAAVDGIVTIDAVGCIGSANRAAATMFGYQPADLLGRDLRSLLQGTVRAEREGHLDRHLAALEGEIVGARREVRGRRRDGSTFDLDISVAALPPAADAGRFIGALPDITERKQMEEQIRMSQRMDAIGRLTGGIAHDFNNLLGIILGNLEMMTDDLPQGAPQRTFIEPVMRAAARGADLTRRLLAFGRRQSLTSQLVDLRGQVRDAVQLLRRTMPESVTIEIEAQSQPVTAAIDVAQLETALVNLALNVRDAMPGGGRLVLEAAMIDLAQDDFSGPDTVPPARYAAVTVQDTGEGMPPAVAERMFESFFSTKGSVKGTGLGLSMVYGFVRQSGGFVQVRTAPDRGTSIRLLFPEGRLETEEPARPASMPVSVTGGGRKILLVEDIADVRRTIGRMLEVLGFEVLPVVDGASALALLAATDGVEVMLTDIGLPGGMDGIDLARLVAERYPHLKIVTRSGHAEGEDADTLGRRPEWRHLAKPFRRDVLADAMKGVFPDVSA